MATTIAKNLRDADAMPRSLRDADSMPRRAEGRAVLLIACKAASIPGRPPTISKR